MRLSFDYNLKLQKKTFFGVFLLQGFETNTDIADISRTVRIRNQFSLAQGENINDLSKTVTDSSNTLQESVIFCVQRFLIRKTELVLIGKKININLNILLGQENT
jgi:hypothetical protein